MDLFIAFVNTNKIEIKFLRLKPVSSIQNFKKNIIIGKTVLILSYI